MTVRCLLQPSVDTIKQQNIHKLDNKKCENQTTLNFKKLLSELILHNVLDE